MIQLTIPKVHKNPVEAEELLFPFYSPKRIKVTIYQRSQNEQNPSEGRASAGYSRVYMLHVRPPSASESVTLALSIVYHSLAPIKSTQKSTYDANHSAARSLEVIVVVRLK